MRSLEQRHLWLWDLGLGMAVEVRGCVRVVRAYERRAGHMALTYVSPRSSMPPCLTSSVVATTPGRGREGRVGECWWVS